MQNYTFVDLLLRYHTEEKLAKSLLSRPYDAKLKPTKAKFFPFPLPHSLLWKNYVSSAHINSQEMTRKAETFFGFDPTT